MAASHIRNFDEITGLKPTVKPSEVLSNLHLTNQINLTFIQIILLLLV